MVTWCPKKRIQKWLSARLRILGLKSIKGNVQSFQMPVKVLLETD